MRHLIISYLTFSTIISGLNIVTDSDKLLPYGPQEFKTRLDFCFWVVSFNSCRNHTNEPSFSSNLMSVAYKRYIDVRFAVHLQ